LVSCSILTADGKRIELGVQTYENCKDSIQVYLNSLDPAERIALIRSAGAAAGTGLIGANFQDMMLAGWFLDAVYKLDQSTNGPNTQEYLNAKADAQQAAINLGPTIYAIWNDPSLTVQQKFAEMEAKGIDVNQLLASAMLGAVVGGLKPGAIGLGQPASQPIPGYRVVSPRGQGASEGALPPGYVNVSRWVSPAEAAEWMNSGGTAIPNGIGAGGRVYVTGPNAPKPGGTGSIRIDFAMPQAAINTAGKQEWGKIMQPMQSTPIYNVKINIPNGASIPGAGK